MKLSKSLFVFSLLVSINLFSQSIVKTLPLPGFWDGYYAHGLTFDGEHLWVGDDYDGMVYCIDTTDGSIIDSFMGTPDYSYGLAFDGQYFWIPSTYTYGPYYFFKFDSLGNKIDSLSSPLNSSYIGGIDFQGNYLWASRYYPNTQPNLFKIDTTNGTAVDSIPTPGLQPMGVAWDGTNIWISMDDNDGDPEKVYKLDPANGNVLLSFDVPTTNPRGLVWDGEYLWLIAKHPDSTKGLLYKYDVNVGMPEINLYASFHNFGIVILGDTATWNLGYSNTGNGDLIVDSMIITGPEFSLSMAFPETLLPDSSSSVDIYFIPGTCGSFSETMFVYSNDPLHPIEAVYLQGESYTDSANIVVSDTLHIFGNLWYKAKHYWNLGVQNLGLDSLKIDSLTFHTNFFKANVSTPVVIPPTSGDTFRIFYMPNIIGNHNDTLRIYSNDPDEPITEIALMGNAIDVNFDSCGIPIWSYTAQGDIWKHIRSIKVLPDIDNDGYDEVLATSENDTLYCFYGNGYGEGQAAWTFTDAACWTERGLITVPDINGDSINDVIYGTIWGSRKVYAISGSNGSVIWSYDTHEYGNGGWVYEVAPFVDITGDNIIEILAATGNDSYNTGPRRIFCLNGATGEKIWEKQLSNYSGFGVRMTEDITGDNIPEVAASSGDGVSSAYNVYLLDGSSGSQMWVTNIGTGAVWTVIPGCDVNGDDTTDIIAGYNGGVCALNIKNGDILWNRTISGDVLELTLIPDINGNGSPEIIPQGAAVSNLSVVDCLTGNIIWSKTLADGIYSVTDISDLTSDGKRDLAVGTGYTNNYLYLINVSNGNILYSSPMSSAMETINKMEDITGDGFDEILVGERNGKISLLSSGNWSGVYQEFDNNRFKNGISSSTIVKNILKIRYSLPVKTTAKLLIIDIQGRIINEKNLGNTKEGLISISTKKYPSGVYHIMIKTAKKSYIRKVLIIK